jgi:hypothetical protein
MFFRDLDPFCIPPASKIPGEFGKELIYYSHMYYLVKIFDLMDTVSIHPLHNPQRAPQGAFSQHLIL